MYQKSIGFACGYIHPFRLKNAKKDSATSTMTPTMIQKSALLPIIGVNSVFIPNIELKSVKGNVTNAMMVSVFMISFCLVVSMALFVSLSAVSVSYCVLALLWRIKYYPWIF